MYFCFVFYVFYIYNNIESEWIENYELHNFIAQDKKYKFYIFECDSYGGFTFNSKLKFGFMTLLYFDISRYDTSVKLGALY